jgi:site-specific DNA-methyltransferase (adenine-specific)
MEYNIQQVDALTFTKSLDKNSVNLVLSDPPYAVSRETNFTTGDLKNNDTDRFRMDYEFGVWDKVDSNYFKLLFKEYYRVLVKGGSVIMFYDLWKVQELKEWLEEAGFKMFRYAEWIKNNPVPINRKRIYLSNAREVMLVCVKGGSPTYNMHWLDETGKYSNQDKGIFNYPICHEAGRFHKTQKPLALIKELVSIHSNEGDVVLDTFLGSGTTAVASIELNRIPLGCELDGVYYPQMEQRINET